MNSRAVTFTFALAAVIAWPCNGSPAVVKGSILKPPPGFTALFNGRDLTGWWGLGTEHYDKYRNLSPEALRERREKSLADIRRHWRVEKGELVNDGHGLYLTTNRFYRDFELLLEYKTVPRADSGVYLRGIPQVQIWDTTEEGGKWKLGADKGSGGLWNNAEGSPGRDPLVHADKPFGEWNRLRIVMIGPYVSVWLNGKRTVKDAELQNYFDRGAPIPPDGPIQLQTHGGEIRWRNIFLREIGPEEADAYLDGLDDEGFEPIFNGKDFTGWAGPVDRNEVADGAIVSKSGTIYTEETFTDFVVKFEFKLPPHGNNGLAIRYPGGGDTAYKGMCEIQVLDDPAYTGLHDEQYHGSIYGMVAARRGYLRPTGEWNFEKVRVEGHRIRVWLNGFLITDGDTSKVRKAMYPLERFAGRLRTSGHFGFAGHGSPVLFRNIKIKRLDRPSGKTPGAASTGGDPVTPAPSP